MAHDVQRFNNTSHKQLKLDFFFESLLESSKRQIVDFVLFLCAISAIAPESGIQAAECNHHILECNNDVGFGQESNIFHDWSLFGINSLESGTN